VVYLPSEVDPPKTLIEQMNLTPNSMGIHGRRLQLAKHLFVSGFAEKGGDVSYGKVPASVDRTAESDDELESVEIKSGLSISIINEILTSSSTSGTDSKDNGSGIFVLNYKFSHTLNQFLFHMSDVLEKKGVDLAVITSSNPEETSRLPLKFGSLSIAAPKSLRHGGFYTSVQMDYDGDHSMWRSTSITTESLP